MPTAGPMVYSFDPTGLVPANLITNELHTITSANFRDYHFIVPTFAPFFGADLVVSITEASNVTRTLLEGVDYLLALPFIGASRACAKPIYGAISFMNLNLSGTIKINQYHTIGGEWTLDVAGLTQILANVIYNPRSTTWEKITELPTVFPVVDHEWNLVDMVGMSPMVTKLDDLEQAILSSGQTGNNAHIANYNNPHQVTKAQVGLGLVENFPVAPVQTAIAGTSASHYITPIALKAVLENFGLQVGVPQEITDHLTNYNNSHQVTKAQVGLGNVANLPVVTSEEAIAGAPVAKYLTMEMFLVYIANHGGTVTIPPAGTLISTFCEGTTKKGTYADGNGGTYDAVIALNSIDCGFVQPVAGTLLTSFCQGTTKVGRYSDGNGGTYDANIMLNSPDCGYVAPPAAGTLISTFCQGTTKMGHYADGSGGTYDAIVTTNSTECGYIAPVFSPKATVTSSPNSIAVGQSSTITFTMTGFLPNTTYKCNVEVVSPSGVASPWNINGVFLVKTFTADATGAATFNFAAVNNGGLENGWWTVKGSFVTQANVAVSTNVTAGQLKFVVNRSLNISQNILVAGPSTPTVAAGQSYTQFTTLTDYVTNSSFTAYYYGLWANNGQTYQYNTRTVTTNANGYVRDGEVTTGLAANLAGVWTIWAVCNGVTSNQTSINFIP